MREKMQLDIKSQSHNRVDWVVRTQILWHELALVLFVALASMLVISTGSPNMWRVVAILCGAAALVAAALAATTPHREIGSVERTPDGGTLFLHRVWLPVGKRAAVTMPVDDISEFRSETAQFQDADEDRYNMARLWVIDKTGAHYLLTGWLDTEPVYELGEVLSKAARCEFDQAELTPTAG